ncbi:hypothetical protein ACFP65_00765 [Marinilactibacillus sp. GCM10026970]
MYKIKITIRDALIYIGILITIEISLRINLDKGDNIQNILMNFLPGAGLMFLGLSIEHKDMSKTIRIIVLSLAIFWLGYISLYYLIGFHNHHWGN